MNFDTFIKQFDNFHNNNKDLNEPLFKVVADIVHSQKKYGLCLEFGVWNGTTISYINNELPNWEIYGFDSFEGLPEKWDRSDDDKYNTGYFTLYGDIPVLHPNIKLIKGWFEKSLPQWIDTNQKYKYIDLLHVDCDIYSSTKTIFKYCKNLINKNTIIVFDELITYPDFEKHEIKAFYEFIKCSSLKFDILYSGGYNSEKVAVIIK